MEVKEKKTQKKFIITSDNGVAVTYVDPVKKLDVAIAKELLLEEFEIIAW